MQRKVINKYLITAMLISGVNLFSPAKDLMAQRTGDVLALFKSSEKYSKGNNPIKIYLGKNIQEKGLKIVYHDFDSGLPDMEDLRNIRAIISWYDSGVVKDKETGLKYIKFLHSAMDLGIKVISVNSFGIYGYQESGNVKWDMISQIKPLFYRLGFNFKGHWSNDPRTLKIVKKDSSMVEYKARQNVAISRHYQQIVPLRDDVLTFLKIRRTNHPDGAQNGDSSVILASKTGCFALESYVVQKGKLLLNPSRFLDKCLFYNDNYQNAGIIVGDISSREKALENIQHALHYAKVDFDVLSPPLLSKMVYGDIQDYEAIMIAVNSVDELPVGLMEKYVKNGGRLVFLRYAKLNKEFQGMTGVFGKGAGLVSVDKGLSFGENFFLNNVSYDTKKISLNVADVKVKGVSVLANASDRLSGRKYPVVWTKKYHKGKVLYWNTDLLLKRKNFRGVIVQSLHNINSNFVTGMANIGIMFIDDWPAPLWNINYKKIHLKNYQKLYNEAVEPQKKKELLEIIARLKSYPDITDVKFARDYWLKDVEKFAREFGFAYSSYIIFNYNRQVDPDDTGFHVKEIYYAKNNQSIRFAREILERGWEIGLHGFNHQSLTITKPEHYHSKPWKVENMERALVKVKKEWILLLGKNSLPFTYVAPHNIIDDKGEGILAKIFPSIRVVSTIYLSTEGETAREFGFGENNRFFYIPRISAGFIMDTGNRHSLYDAFHNFGIVMHFVHPDDVFDLYRSSRFSGWDKMKREFRRDFRYFKKNFPWFRWYTTKDAFYEFLFYFNTNIKIRNDKNKLVIYSSDGSQKDLFLRFRLDKSKRIKKVKNCRLVQYNKRSGDVILSTNKARCTVLFR